MEAPDFWDNAEVSQKKMKELKSMKDDMETYQNLVTQKEDMETLIEMSYEENDPSMIEEIQEMLDEFQAQMWLLQVYFVTVLPAPLWLRQSFLSCRT